MNYTRKDVLYTLIIQDISANSKRNLVLLSFCTKKVEWGVEILHEYLLTMYNISVILGHIKYCGSPHPFYVCKMKKEICFK